MLALAHLPLAEGARVDLGSDPAEMALAAPLVSPGRAHACFPADFGDRRPWETEWRSACPEHVIAAAAGARFVRGARRVGVVLMIASPPRPSGCFRSCGRRSRISRRGLALVLERDSRRIFSFFERGGVGEHADHQPMPMQATRSAPSMFDVAPTDSTDSRAIALSVAQSPRRTPTPPMHSPSTDGTTALHRGPALGAAERKPEPWRVRAPGLSAVRGRSALVRATHTALVVRRVRRVERPPVHRSSAMRWPPESATRDRMAIPVVSPRDGVSVFFSARVRQALASRRT